MKKILLIIFAFLLVGHANAQSNLSNVKTINGQKYSSPTGHCYQLISVGTGGRDVRFNVKNTCNVTIEFIWCDKGEKCFENGISEWVRAGGKIPPGMTRKTRYNGQPFDAGGKVVIRSCASPIATHYTEPANMVDSRGQVDRGKYICPLKPYQFPEEYIKNPDRDLQIDVDSGNLF